MHTFYFTKIWVITMNKYLAEFWEPFGLFLVVVVVLFSSCISELGIGFLGVAFAFG
jgi:hypothetical protein